MFTKRIIAALLIASLFSACASRAPSNSSKGCQNTSSTKSTYTARDEITEEKMLVWDMPIEAENNAVYGIQGLSFDKVPSARVPYLEVKLFGKVKNIEYQARVYKHIEALTYESSPGIAAITTTILVGLPLIFAPGWVADKALGCSEERSSQLVPSKTDRVPTGNEKWVDYAPKSVRLSIAVGEDAPLDREFEVKSGSALINLENYVNLKNAKNQLNIKVQCLTCKNLRNEDLGLSYSHTKDILLDVGQIRSAEAANKKKLDDAAIAAKQRADEDRAKALEEKQKAADRAAQAKVESVAKAQAAEQKILDQYKEKCTNLGFKVGTDAFGKCVLQLTK